MLWSDTLDVVAAETDLMVTAALKSLGIIPRTPNPTPLEDRPIAELSREEMAALLDCYRVCWPS